MKRALLALALLAACSGEKKVDQQCTVIDEGDGTATIACPTGSVRVPLGNVDVACTLSQLPAGGSRIYCSNGLEIRIDASGNVIFPGGGSISGQAYLLGEQGRAGIRITAGDHVAFTDETGEFTLPGLPAGIYRLEFEYPGYATHVEINVPAVGNVWRIEDGIVLYPGHAITSVNPTNVLLSPSQDTLLVQTLRTSGVGPLSLHVLDPTVADPSDRDVLSSDARGLSPEGSYRDDGGAVAWVEHLQPEGGVAVVRTMDRAPGDPLPRRELSSFVRFFGDQVLVVGTELAPGVFLWDPATGEEVRITGENRQLAELIPVSPGETLIVQRSQEGAPPLNFLWRRSSPDVLEPFGHDTPQVAGGGAAAIGEDGAVVGVYGSGPLARFNPPSASIDPTELFIAPDGRTAVTTQPARGWDLVEAGSVALPESASGGVTFTPDGATAVYSSGSKGFRVNLRNFRAYDVGTPDVQRVVPGRSGELVYESPSGLWYWEPGDPVPSDPVIGSVLSSWAYEPTHHRVVYTLQDRKELWTVQLGRGKPEPILVDELGTPGNFRIGELGIVYERAERRDEEGRTLDPPLTRTWSFDPEAKPTQIGEAANFGFSDESPRMMPGGVGFYGTWSQGTFFCDMRTGRQRFYKVEDVQIDVRAVAPDRLIYEIADGGTRNGVFVMYVR